MYISGRLFRFWLLLSTIPGIALLSSCQKKADPLPANTLAVLDPVQLIRNQDVAATSVILTSRMLSSGNEPIVTIGQLCSTTNRHPTLDDQDAHWAREVRVGTLPFRFTTGVTGLLPATHYYTRVYVTNTTGTTYGPTVQFTTLARQKTVFATLAQILDDSMRPKDVGYAFTIYQGATLMATGAGGPAARPVDPGGGLPFTINTKMHVASISKTITAFTLVALLAQKGLELTTPITPYLPQHWRQGPDISRITFIDLLTHRSGLTSSSTNCQGGPFSENGYAFLRQAIAQGVTRHGQYCYQNLNYALLRVLIPALMGYRNLDDDPLDNSNTSRLYRQAVDSIVFAPLGLPTIGVKQPDQAAYLYSYPYSGSQGYSTGDFTGLVGALGWYLTAAEAGQLFARVLSSPDQSVLSTSSKAKLLGNGLGCFASMLKDQTVVYFHDGWQWEADPSRAGTYRGLRTVWMKYPDDVTLVLFVNAINSNRLFPSTSGLDIVAFVDQAYSRARQIQYGRMSHYSGELEHIEPH